jgi:hypothetical protein
VESLELEEWRVWKHELKGKHPIFFFFFFFGFGGCHHQFSTEANSFFFLFFWLLLGVGGHHHQVSAKSQAPSFSFFFLCVLFLVDADGFHHQLLGEEEPNLPFFSFFSFCFATYGCRWAPSPTFNKEGAYFLFSLFVLLLMGISGCHHQVLAEGELAPPFFHFCFVSSWVPSLGLSRRGS